MDLHMARWYVTLGSTYYECRNIEIILQLKLFILIEMCVTFLNSLKL